MLILMAVLICAHLILRLIDRVISLAGYSAVGLRIPSYMEVASYLYVAAAFMALSATFVAGQHIRVGLITGGLSVRPARILEIVVSFIAILISAFATWATAKLAYTSWAYSSVSNGTIKIQLWVPQTSIALGLLLLTLAVADYAFGVCSGRHAIKRNLGE